MTNFTPHDIVSFVAAAAMSAFTQVKLDTNGQLVNTGAGEYGIGTIEQDCAVGDTVAVRMRGAPGTRIVSIASGTGSRGALLYSGSGGNFFSSASGAPVYRALSAWTVAGNYEVEPVESQAVDELVGTQTVTAGDVTNGYVDIAHAFAANPRGVAYRVTNAAGTTTRVCTDSFPDTNTLRITPTGITAGDVVRYWIKK